MSKSYLDFRRLPTPPERKTPVWSVDSRSGGYRLAIIKWWGPWRQYIVEPERATVWNNSCLREVAGFLDALNHEHRLNHD